MDLPRALSWRRSARPLSPPHHEPTFLPSQSRSPMTETSRALSSLSLPLAIASTVPIRQASPPTPSSVTQDRSMSAARGHRLPQTGGMPGAGVLSPPTPAPSPTPKEWRMVDEDDEEMDDLREGEGRRWKGKGNVGETEPEELLRNFQGLTKSQRFAFLAALVGELRLNEALVVSRKIEPRLKRDFLRELPLELSLHCLSFVDDAKTLSRASQVSRFWGQLLQDEKTWKDMCDRHRFTAIPSPITQSTYQPNLPRRGTLASFLSAFANATGSKPFSGSLPNPLERRQSQPVHSTKFKTVPAKSPSSKPSPSLSSSFKQQFKKAYLTESNWLSGGRLLANHTSHDDGVVTSVAVDESYIVIGMANSRVHVFSAHTGHFRHSLVGHELGVWALVLVAASSARTPTTIYSKSPNSSAFDDADGSRARMPKAPGTYRDDGQTRRASFNGPGPDQFESLGAPTQADSSMGNITRPNTALGFGPGAPRMAPAGTGLGVGRPRLAKRMQQSDVCGGARGWGNKRSLVVSGGCDREIKVWDVETGKCIHSLAGHSSTIRCLKVLDGRPIAVSGSRDWTLRVWDIERGTLIHTLSGHDQSVRCIEVAGNQVVSGSYDFTCRLWDVDTGECLHVLRGHYHQIYAVAFDGEKVVTGSLDSTVRVWSAATGECIALLQGHTSLVGQLQLSGDRLVTGGSDGRVIIFNLQTLECVHRLCAHDNSVTCLQFDDRFIVSGGNDGRVKLWDVHTGTFIRELTKPCDAVWRVNFRDDKVSVLCQRGGRTTLEVLSFRAGEEKGRGLLV